MDGYEKEKNNLNNLCNQVRSLIAVRDFTACYELIVQAMYQYPDAPQPHNLLGILLDKQGDKSLSMKHFRAAYALDPTYLPTRHNLDIYTDFYPTGSIAYDESDCPPLILNVNHKSRKE